MSEFPDKLRYLNSKAAEQPEPDDLRKISGIITSVQTYLERTKFLGKTANLEELLFMYDLRDPAQIEKYLNLSKKRGIVWEKTKEGNYKLIKFKQPAETDYLYSEKKGRKHLQILQGKLGQDKIFTINDISQALGVTSAVAVKISVYLLRYKFIEYVSAKNQTRAFKFSSITPETINGEVPKNSSRQPK